MSDPGDQTETLLGTQAPDAPAARPLGGSPPRLLGGRYLLEERIASGGMASVWRAHDEVLARTVGIKILHDHLAADEGFRERFRREAIAAAKLTHPNVVGLYDTGNDGDQVYLVMEYVAGVTLKHIIAREGALEVGRAAAIGEKVARALDYAHERGLVHRDVKPANILIGLDGSVKVADFGIAKAEEGDDLTKTGMVLGTAAYVAPEQILAEPIDGKADQYALACVLYEALTGQQPFKADSAVATAAQRLETDPLPLRARRADVPRALDDIIMRALSRRPEDRFPTLGRFADALAPFADADDSATAALAAAAAQRPSAAPRIDDGGDDTGDLADAGGALRAAVARGDDDTTVPSERRSPGDSFLGSEGRWLAAVLVIIVLVGALVAVGFATGVLDPQRIPIISARDGDDEQADAEPPPQPVALDVVDVAAFDPQGDGSENDDELAQAIDGDPNTAWRTEGYDTAAFGNLKEGVGLIVDLGETQPLHSVQLDTPTPGFSYELRVADAGPPSQPSDWDTVVRVAAAQGSNRSTLDGVAARYVLVWVTGDLPPDGGRHRAAVSELTVFGAEAASRP